jgi:NADPH:quinone reductase-like Zn-dependent oxidoreductase
MAGFDTIITTAAKVHEESLKKLGATHVLDRHSTVDAKTIQKIASNVTLVYDTVCNENTTSLSISILATGGGTIARTSPYEGADLPPTISSKFIVGIFHYNAAGEGVPFYAALEKWLADGTLKPNETEVFEGIERADEAVTRLSKGVNRKKVVVKFT